MRNLVSTTSTHSVPVVAEWVDDFPSERWPADEWRVATDVELYAYESYLHEECASCSAERGDLNDHYGHDFSGQTASNTGAALVVSGVPVEWAKTYEVVNLLVTCGSR